MGHIHAGHPATSLRLRLVLDMLTERGSAGATTWELHSLDNDLAAGTTVSELRANGYEINCKQLPGRNEQGKKVYRYTLQTNCPLVTLPSGELVLNF